MMFVLLAALLLSVVTVGVLRMVAADITEGFGGLESVQTFSVAEAGIHYAIGQLQTGAANAYAGETITITSGATTLGTATITVNCIVSGSAPPCTGASDAAYPGYRRIVSTSTLPTSGASGGPTRTIVAVVQGTSSGGGGGWSSAVCGLSSVTDYTTSSADITNVYGDIVANGPVNLTPSLGETVRVLGDPGSPQKYTGRVSSTGTVTCGVGCSAAGGISQNQPGPLCSAPPLPTFAPGALNQTVAPGTTYTMNPGSGYSFNNFMVSRGTCAGANPFTTLQIVAPGGPGTTTVVQLNTLTIAPCGRLVITGAGNIELRIGATTGESLNVGGAVGGMPHADQSTPVHFGVGTSDTLSIPAPVPASQLIVWVNSDGNVGAGADCDTPTSCAAFISHASGGVTVVGPKGTVQLDDSATPNPLYGAVLGKQVNLSGNGTFTQDTSGLSGFGPTTYSNFNSLRSWKDQ